MARYWVMATDRLAKVGTPSTTVATGYTLVLQVDFVGADVVGQVQRVEVAVELLFTDPPATFSSKAIDAIVAAGLARGWTVQRTDGLLPSFVRGS